MSQQVSTSVASDGLDYALAPEPHVAAPSAKPTPQLPTTDSGTRRLQIVMSPYQGQPDFSALTDEYKAQAPIDMVSVADLLRNGFVHAPHSIYQHVKLATPGFDPLHDMHVTPEFRYQFRDIGRSQAGAEADTDTDWVEEYHRLLCDAFAASCREIRSPWLLQSGGKDSTPLAIAAAEVRPETRCITYLGGSEENEVASASLVAKRLGLRHDVLVCDPGRAYDRYLQLLPRMPLLTADFALLSYADLATAVAAEGGDGVIDGMGADGYFGTTAHARERVLARLALGLRLPRQVTELPLLGRSFELCYLLSTLQMGPTERAFPGSRFTDAEVDGLFGRDVAHLSKARLDTFRQEIESATSFDESWAIANSIWGITGGFAKALYTAGALSQHVAYPFCDRTLREWVYTQVPSAQRIDPVTRANKVLVRRYIAKRFEQLPYVAQKGCFRFDLCGLAKQRFEQVHAFAERAHDLLPGATRWLERNRNRLDNKYHASKFYLLAIVLPWLVQQSERRRVRQEQERVQITMSPYYGKPNFSAIDCSDRRRGRLDAVSVADLLRNGFVYPPHSIFDDVKLATFGFDPKQDMHDAPQFHFDFPDSGKRSDAKDGDAFVDEYHRLLCEAFERSCAGIRAPWLLQSGGKDSTTLAIAAAEVRPETVCITYLGGHEENEIASAQSVAKALGLRHEVMFCDPGRAYDRYLAILPRMPLLTADFALLSYMDMAAMVAANEGDGIVDGLGSDIYFGTPMRLQHRILSRLARELRLPGWLTELPLVDRSFKLCYLLSTLQMNPSERLFPGSRFTDTEVDAIFGRDIARLSKARLASFRSAIASVATGDDWKAITLTISESAGGIAKGLYTTSALSLQAAYPFCDRALRDWVYRQVPADQHIDPVTRANKALVRRHIAKRFDRLPYVAHKGCFRFDLRGLAKQRFDQVQVFAEQARDALPGAVEWLERNRNRLDNKYHASRFYLLAIVLPWLVHHERAGVNGERAWQ
jgi:asparagine synthetase B (glutamine-hydrolysing)